MRYPWAWIDRLFLKKHDPGTQQELRQGRILVAVCLGASFFSAINTILQLVVEGTLLWAALASTVAYAALSLFVRWSGRVDLSIYLAIAGTLILHPLGLWESGGLESMWSAWLPLTPIVMALFLTPIEAVVFIGIFILEVVVFWICQEQSWIHPAPRLSDAVSSVQLLTALIFNSCCAALLESGRQRVKKELFVLEKLRDQWMEENNRSHPDPQFWSMAAGPLKRGGTEITHGLCTHCIPKLMGESGDGSPEGDPKS